MLLFIWRTISPEHLARNHQAAAAQAALQCVGAGVWAQGPNKLGRPGPAQAKMVWAGPRPVNLAHGPWFGPAGQFGLLVVAVKFPPKNSLFTKRVWGRIVYTRFWRAVFSVAFRKNVPFLVPLFEKKKVAIEVKGQLSTEKNFCENCPRARRNYHTKQGQLSLLMWQQLAKILRDLQIATSPF